MSDKHWAVVVFISCLENTKETVLDLLAQTVDTNVLLVDNGSGLAEWEEMREWAAGDPGRIYPWRHNPPLPSLAATWNAALDFIWASGGTEAMVCNNDIRVRPWMYAALLWAKENTGALFVSGVNTPKGYEKHKDEAPEPNGSKGGPDFSCYLITKAGHQKYRCDENFSPAYCEDLDLHRRYMLGGDGARILSVNLPYLHKDGGSGTLKSFSKERADWFHRAVDAGSRSYYRAKWGGGVNEETFLLPFTPIEAQEESDPTWAATRCKNGCVTTPQLQAHGCRGGRID